MTRWNPARSPRARLGAAWALLILLLLALPALASAESEVDLGVGEFLVASRQLKDPNFRETVVVIVEYGRFEGAVGLVINRPTDVELSRVMPDFEGAADSEELVYRGGPVDPMRFAVLLRSSEPEADKAHQHVFGDVYFSGSRGLLEWLAGAKQARGLFRAYAGYAGWAPGQLEAEIARGGWHLVSGEATAIFEEPSDKIWPRLILRGTAEWARLPNECYCLNFFRKANHSPIGIPAKSSPRRSSR